MEKHDIVIVGAGPAGLKAAEVLAAAGKDVLVLEKNKVVGPKVCAGGISIKCKELGIPDDIFERSFHSAIVSTPYQKNILRYDKNVGYTIDRAVLGAYLEKKAKDKGAIIRTNCRVTSITKDDIICCGKKIKYNYLIGADGSISIVRKYLNIPIKKICIAMQYIVIGKKEDLELNFGYKKSGSWYSWIFPYKDSFSVGTGAKLGTLNTSFLRKELDLLCKEKDIDLNAAEFQAATINVDYRGLKFGNIFLVGDAAGLVFGFSGEGIYPAMISGEIVAKSIIDKNYDYNKDISKLLEHKKLQESVLYFLENSHVFKPLLFEFLALSLKTNLGRKKFAELLA